MTLKKLWQRAVDSAYVETFVYGRVGKHNTDTSVDYAVPGRTDYLWVTLSDRTVKAARNEAGVPQTEDLQVKLRVEHGEHVIVGRSTNSSLSVPSETPPSGVLAHASSHQHGGSDEVATATPAANAIPKADASGLLDAWVTPGGTQEQVEDWVAAQLTPNTGRVQASYDDGTGAITLILDVSAADKILYSTGADAWAEADLTSFARNLLDDADAATARATLGVTVYDQETTEDSVGAMVSGNIETGITVTYNDATGKIDFDAQTAGDARYLRLTGGTLTGALALLGTLTITPSITSTIQTGNADAAMVFVADRATATNIAFRFRDAAGNPSVDILDNGNMGIGQTAAQVPLHVGPGNDAPASTLANVLGYFTRAGAALVVARNETADIEAIFGVGSTTGLFGTQTNHPLDFRVNGATVAQLDTSGRFGIGVTTQQGILHTHDGTAGHLVVTKTGVNGTPQVIIDGTVAGDVTQACMVDYLVYSSAGVSSGRITLVQGGTMSANISIGGGALVLTLTLTAGGQLSVARTVGSVTSTIKFAIDWI